MSSTSGFATFDNALTYVNGVKERFANEPQVFQQFLQLLSDAKKPGGHAQLKQQVEVLFQGHPDLIRGFEALVPRPPSSQQ